MKRTALALGVLLLAAAPVFGTTLLRMDVQDLTRYSNAVVIGTVVGQTTLSDQPGPHLGKIQVEVEEALKGDLEGTVTVLNPGFAGAPVFQVGDEVVLFVYSRDGKHVLTGFQQGSFKIVTDASGNKVLDRGIPSRANSVAGVRSLDALIAEILAAAQ